MERLKNHMTKPHVDQSGLTPTYRLSESGFPNSGVTQANADRFTESERLLEFPTCSPGMVRIIHGANVDVLPVGGQTVGRVRYEVGGLFNIAPGAHALVGNKPASEDHALQHGESLEFISPFGSKGVGNVWRGEGEIREQFGLSEEHYAYWLSLGLPVHRFPDGHALMTEDDFDRWSESVLLSNSIPGRITSDKAGACPDLLTEEQAIRYLRLDEIVIRNPEETLRRYRREGHLRGTQVSKRVYYLRAELDAFLKRRTEENLR